jgi:transposase-like protein
MLPFTPYTNAIEALNRHMREGDQHQGKLPNEDAARKLVYLALQTAFPRWTRTRNRRRRCTRSEIHFGACVPELQTAVIGCH